jgi:hypothetical protein
VDRLCRALVFLILIAYGFFFLHHAGRVISYPLDVDNSEGYLLNEARLWAEGKHPYRDFNSPPYLVANYPPLYPLILSLPIRFGSLSFAWGRALSALSVVGVSVVIYLIVWGRTRNHYWSAVGAFLFPSFSQVYSWGPLHRVDLLGLFLVALGIWMIERKRRVVWPLLCFLAALFTRQTYVAPVLAAGYYLIRENRKRDGGWLLGGFFGAGAVLFAIFSILTHGEFFRQTILYNMNKYQWEHAWPYQLQLWQRSSVFLAFAAVFLIVQLREHRNDWLPAYLILAWLVSLTAGKVGSAENYLLELVFTICVAVPLGCVKVREAFSGHRPGWAFIAPLLILFGCLQNFHVPRSEGLPGPLSVFGRRYDYAFTPLPDDYRAAADLLSYGKRIRGPVLSQIPGWPLLSGHEVLFHVFLVRQLSIQGRFDEEHLLSMVREGEFAAILTSDDLGPRPHPPSIAKGNERFSLDFYVAMAEAGYVRAGAYPPGYYLYQPVPKRPPQDEPFVPAEQE